MAVAARPIVLVGPTFVPPWAMGWLFASAKSYLETELQVPVILHGLSNSGLGDPAGPTGILTDALHTLDLKAFDLVGYSQGGNIAAAVAPAFLGQIGHLVFWCSAVNGSGLASLLSKLPVLGRSLSHLAPGHDNVVGLSSVVESCLRHHVGPVVTSLSITHDLVLRGHESRLKLGEVTNQCVSVGVGTNHFNGYSNSDGLAELTRVLRGNVRLRPARSSRMRTAA